MHCVRRVAIVLLALMCATTAAALETAEVRDIFYEGTIVLDRDGTLTLEEALAEAEALAGQPRQRVAAGGNAYWLVEKLTNPGDVPSWWVEVFAARSDYIDLYVLKDGIVEQHVKAGLLRQVSDPRVVKSMGSHVLTFTLPPGEDRTLALRVQSRSLINYSIKAGPDYALNTPRVNRHFIVYSLMGGMIFLVLYNLFLGLALRELDYFLYSAHGLSYFLFFFNSYGFAATLLGWTAHPWITVYAGFAIEIFGIAFVWRFLRVRDWSPVLSWLMLGCLAFLIALVIATPFAGYLVMAELWMITYALVPFLVLAASLIGIFRGVRQSLFILIGWTPMVAMTLIAMIAMMGYLERPPSGAAINSSVLLEMLILSLALADRVRRLQGERERAIQEGREKSTFLAMLSHEVRTPLNGIMGTVELLGRTRLDRAQRDHVSNLKHAGNALLSLLNDVLQLAKSEAGKDELHLSRVALVDVTRSMCNLMSARATDKGLDLVFRTEGDVPEFVEADEARLRQVLLNLVSNAVKFTDKGRVEVVVKGESAGAGKARIKFSVADTGIGIAEQDKERLFKPFVQLSNADREASEGTGLGLSISHELVHAMGGKLEVESRQGAGSRFYFSLDLHSATAPEPETTEVARSSDQYGTSESLHILVVDDVPLNRDVLRELLTHYGHAVETAASGTVALERASANQFDVIVTDIYMPDMDGLQLGRRLRRRKDKARLIGLTAAYDDDLRVESASIGFDLLLAKPVSGETLHRGILGVLDLQRADGQADEAQIAHFEPSYLEGYVQMLGGAHTRQLIAEFHQTVEAELERLAGALQSGNLTAMAVGLHKLAGTLSTVGLLRLGKTLETRSALIRSGKATTIDIAALRAELDRARAEVDDYIAHYGETGGAQVA